MGIREDVLALADELEGVSLKDDCESCLASGTGLCRGDLECAESAHKACAKRLREIVEHDECEVTTVSAYDLLSEEDREAIAWVHEMGGVNALSRGFQDADNRRIELCSSLGIDLETGWADAMVAMRRRLMPEGMEWPRYDTGEPLEVGQTVYATHYDYARCTVLSFELAVDGWLVEVENEGGHKFRQTPDCFTHQRPEPPDSWERIEADVMADAKDYCESRGIRPEYPKHSGKAKCEDIVRRCRALAERGEL